MGLLGGLAKVGLAKRAYREVQKPQNQARLKRLWSRVTGGGRSRGTAARR